MNWDIDHVGLTLANFPTNAVDDPSELREYEHRQNYSNVGAQHCEQEPDRATHPHLRRRVWSRRHDLFRLIDNGESKLGIPAYNSGLFDDSQH